MRRLAMLAMVLAVILPLRLPAQYTRRRTASATATPGPAGAPPVSFNGTVKSVNKKDLVLDLDPPDPQAERQTLTFRFSRKTRFLKGDQVIKPSDIELGTHISLDAIREGDLKLTAVNVFVAPPPDKNGEKPAGK